MNDNEEGELYAEKLNFDDDPLVEKKPKTTDFTFGSSNNNTGAYKRKAYQKKWHN